MRLISLLSLHTRSLKATYSDPLLATAEEKRRRGLLSAFEPGSIVSDAAVRLWVDLERNGLVLNTTPRPATQNTASLRRHASR